MGIHYTPGLGFYETGAFPLPTTGWSNPGQMQFVGKCRSQNAGLSFGSGGRWGSEFPGGLAARGGRWGSEFPGGLSGGGAWGSEFPNMMTLRPAAFRTRDGASAPLPRAYMPPESLHGLGAMIATVAPAYKLARPTPFQSLQMTSPGAVTGITDGNPGYVQQPIWVTAQSPISTAIAPTTNQTVAAGAAQGATVGAPTGFTAGSTTTTVPTGVWPGTNVPLNAPTSLPYQDSSGNTWAWNGSTWVIASVAGTAASSTVALISGTSVPTNQPTNTPYVDASGNTWTYVNGAWTITSSASVWTEITNWLNGSFTLGTTAIPNWTLPVAGIGLWMYMSKKKGR